MVLLFSGQEPVEAFAWDAMPLTAAEGKEVLAARPSTHVPIGAGDRSVAGRRVELVMPESVKDTFFVVSVASASEQEERSVLLENVCEPPVRAMVDERSGIVMVRVVAVVMPESWS